MALTRTRAIVLQVFPYGETSKILRLLSPEYGLRSVIAKGAQRPRSRFGGLLEPFTEGEAHFLLKEGRDLHTLTGFDLYRARQALGRNLTAFAAASLLAELLIRSGTEEPQPDLYHAFVRTLDNLAETEPRLVVSRALTGIWEMVALLGFQPELELCLSCGRRFDPDEPTRFDVEAGGAVCTSCRPTGRVVDPVTRDEILRMTRGRPAREGGGDLSLQRALLRVFLATHLSHGARLRSLPLALELLR